MKEGLVINSSVCSLVNQYPAVLAFDDPNLCSQSLLGIMTSCATP